MLGLTPLPAQIFATAPRTEQLMEFVIWDMVLNFRLGSLKKKEISICSKLLPSPRPLPQPPCTAELHWSHCKEETN